MQDASQKKTSGKKVRHIVKNYLTGHLRCAEFALTNVCIAKCSFCNIWKQQPKVMVDREKALQAVDKMAELGVGHITFTGGEPLMHPNVVEFIERATRHNIHNAVLDAAPRLVTKNDMHKKLEAAGCDLVSISFDSGDPVTMAQSRQIDNIMDEMKDAMAEIKKTSLKTMASVLIWNDNYKNLEHVCENAVNMGFDLISLNYPTFSDSSVYELGGSAIDFSKEELIWALEASIKLKESGKYPLINSAPSMRNIVNYLKDPALAKYHCFGGKHVMFVDWFFDVYACMQLPKPIGNLFNITEKDLNIPTCNKCNMSWYRDFSMFYHGAKSVPVLWDAMRNSSGLI